MNATRLRWLACTLLATATLSGCSGCDETDTQGTGGTAGDGGGGGSGLTLELPAAGITDCHPSLIDADGVCRPSLDKCPLGSIPDVDIGCVPIGVPDCAPEFVDARGICLPTATSCSAGSFPVPTLGCVPIDGPEGCGTGTWGNVPDAPENLYIDAAYEGGASDGSLAAPYVTLSQALAAATPGARIVLAAGSYQAGVTLSSSLELRGVCASKVTLINEENFLQVLSLQAPADQTITVSDLSISADLPSIAVLSGKANLTRVHIAKAIFRGIEAKGSSAVVTMDQCLVQNVTAGGPRGVGSGIMARQGGSIVVQRSAVLGVQTGALYANGGDLSADDVTVAGTLADAADFGYAGVSQAGGKLTLRRTVMNDNYQGIYVDTQLNVEDSVLGATIEPLSDRVTHVDGDLTVRRTAVVDGPTWGITSYQGQNGLATIEHVLVADLGTPATDGNNGILLAEGGLLSKSTTARIHGAGVTLVKDTTVVGLVVEDGIFTPQFGLGSGVTVYALGGQISLDRCYLRNIEDAAIQTFEPGTPTSLKITHSRIEDLPGVDGNSYGVGLALTSPDMLVEVEDTAIENTRSAGVYVLAGDFAMRRSLVRNVALGTLNRFIAGVASVGPIADGVLFLGSGAGNSMELEDVWIEETQRAGVLASGEAHKLTRVRVQDTRVGLALRDGATATLTDCDLSGNNTETEDPTEYLIP